MPNYPKNLTSQVFGKLTVIAKTGKTRHHNSLWLCQCDCGALKSDVLYGSLVSGRTQTCGECTPRKPKTRRKQ